MAGRFKKYAVSYDLVQDNVDDDDIAEWRPFFM
jgi:hypothetical protein